MCTINERHHTNLEKELGTSILSCSKLKKHATGLRAFSELWGKTTLVKCQKINWSPVPLLFNVSKNPKLLQSNWYNKFSTMCI